MKSPAGTNDCHNVCSCVIVFMVQSVVVRPNDCKCSFCYLYLGFCLFIVIRREENNTIPAVSQVLDGFIEMKIVVETSTIAITNLAKLYPKEYFEGRSRPRKFGIVLNSCFNEREVIPGT